MRHPYLLVALRRDEVALIICEALRRRPSVKTGAARDTGETPQARGASAATPEQCGTHHRGDSGQMTCQKLRLLPARTCDSATPRLGLGLGSSPPPPRVHEHVPHAVGGDERKHGLLLCLLCPVLSGALPCRAATHKAQRVDHLRHVSAPAGGIGAVQLSQQPSEQYRPALRGAATDLSSTHCHPPSACVSQMRSFLPSPEAATNRPPAQLASVLCAAAARTCSVSPQAGLAPLPGHSYMG
eukprot:COSAG01_NODE_7178_length_3317_cov_3.132070_5_plen_241_part_00